MSHPVPFPRTGGAGDQGEKFRIVAGTADTPVCNPTNHVAENDEELEQKGGRVALRVVLYARTTSPAKPE